MNQRQREDNYVEEPDLSGLSSKQRRGEPAMVRIKVEEGREVSPTMGGPDRKNAEYGNIRVNKQDFFKSFKVTGQERDECQRAILYNYNNTNDHSGA